MKPRNKFEVHVTELSSKLPAITQEQKNYAYSKCFTYQGVQSRKTISCLECGHEDKTKVNILKDETIKHICGGCGKTIAVKKHTHPIYIKANYIASFKTVENFQVVRIFFVEKYMKRKTAATFYCNEVVQHWFNSNNKHAILAKRVSQSYYMDNWVTHDDISIKDYHERYFLSLNIFFPGKKILPDIKRNGFKNNFYGIHPVKFFKHLLNNSYTETLLKSNQIELLKESITTYKDFNKYWSSIKICIRNNYIVKDAKNWIDYIDLLAYFNKDLSNKKYVCPIDLDKEHDKYVLKKRIALRKIETEEKKKTIAADQKVYRKEKKQFFNLIFAEDNVTIKPLKTIKSFIDEGDYFNHCLYTNEYYKRKDSLIMSALVNGERMETIEICLETFNILQARGKGNKSTPHHKKIIEIINKNIYQIQNIINPKKISA